MLKKKKEKQIKIKMNFKLGWLFAIIFITIVNGQVTNNSGGQTNNKTPAPQDSKLYPSIFVLFLFLFLPFKNFFFSKNDFIARKNVYRQLYYVLEYKNLSCHLLYFFCVRSASIRIVYRIVCIHMS